MTQRALTRALSSAVAAALLLFMSVGCAMASAGACPRVAKTHRHTHLHRSARSALALPRTRPFAANSFWNTPLACNAPVDRHSGAYVADLQRQLRQWLPWINTTSYSSPVYTVPVDQPVVPVTVDRLSSDGQQTLALREAFSRVPIPVGAQSALGTDQVMVIWQPAWDTLWEFWGAIHEGDGWHARWGGRITHVSTNPGYYTDHPLWGASASGLPILGGLIRISELRAGHIDHVLSLQIPQPRAGIFVWPARRTDGILDSPNAIAEGTRLRLDPALDINSLHLPLMAKMIAVAAQRYGMLVTDKAGAVTFSAEDPTPTGLDPYSGPGGFFGGQWPSKVLARFPWSSLRVLAVPPA
jgi:hypothetical protein